MDKLFIPVLQGTTRSKRRSIHVARFIVDVVKSIDGVETQLVDPVDFNFPEDGNDEENKDPKYTKIVQKADAFLAVVPEYNHAYPSTLKRMLDSELKLYIHKPIAFAGVSGGPWGGIRAIENLVPAVREMGLIATFTDVQFPFAGKLFDKTGAITKDNIEKYENRVKKTFAELIWMTKTLKWGRENLPS